MSNIEGLTKKAKIFSDKYVETMGDKKEAVAAIATEDEELTPENISARAKYFLGKPTVRNYIRRLLLSAGAVEKTSQKAIELLDAKQTIFDKDGVMHQVPDNKAQGDAVQRIWDALAEDPAKIDKHVAQYNHYEESEQWDAWDDATEEVLIYMAKYGKYPSKSDVRDFQNGLEPLTLGPIKPDDPE